MKKLLAIVLVASFAFVGAFNASAVTIEELQAQIATLLQQIAALSGTTTTTTAATTTCFSTDLSQGMTSNDVKLLQEKLGVINTGYFGPLTLAAVKTYQGANGIPTTGYVGPLTRGSLNAKYCVTTPVTTTPTSTTSTTPVTGLEGTLTNEASPTFVDTILKKGETNKAILATVVKAKNSTITLKRVDVELAGTSIQPWKTFSSFDLYAAGTLVKNIPALKENFIESTFVTTYVLRFDNISIPVAKDGSVDLVVKANILANPENTAITTFKFQASSIRGLDQAGIDQYTSTVITNTVSGSAVAASSTGTLVWSLNSSSPKTGFVIGNATATSADKTLSIYDVKAENRDVTIKTLLVTMTDADTIVNAVKLYDGSTLLASVAGANGDVTFSNLSILVAKDTTKTLTIKVDLKPLAAEGKLIAATVTGSAANVTAFDSADAILSATACNSGECITGTATGKTLTAYTKAPLLTFVSANITKTVQAGQDDQADATIVFDITAQGGDIYFKSNTTLATIVIDDGMATHNNFDAANGADKGVGTYTFASTAEVYDANTFLVKSGQTARVTISGHVTTVGATGYTNMALDELIWGTDNTPTEYTIQGIDDTGAEVVNYDLSTFKTNDVSLTRVTA